MKADKKIAVAFWLNLIFSIIEFIGGAITGSIAIVSDAIHDLGDCMSIGVSALLEKISRKKATDKYTYGYFRFSVLGSVIQSSLLLFGSIVVIYNSVLRLINPVPINYHGMIFIAIIGFITNFIAAYFTSGGNSLNQKSINLHMIEDVLGWAIVLIGAIVMNFTNFAILDSLLSIGLAFFIIYNALKNLKTVLDIFLEKTPNNIDIPKIKEELLKIDGIIDIHHLHIWSMDGFKNSATLHIVTNADFAKIKHMVKDMLNHFGISHSTVECEGVDEDCSDMECDLHLNEHNHHHHHHH